MRRAVCADTVGVMAEALDSAVAVDGQPNGAGDAMVNVAAPGAAEASQATRSWRLRPGLFDAGWLLLIPGILIVATMVILPAMEDRERARFYRDRAVLVEQHSQARLANHAEYLAALKRGDEGLLKSLAAVQLNKVPQGMALLTPGEDLSRTSAAVFDRLEPPQLMLNEYHREYSTLEKIALGERSRLWAMGLGALLIFAGLLPATRS